MLGPPKPRCLHQPIAVSLEELVPLDHFYRHLETKLDLTFVREWVRECYAERGRPSIDPVIFFKLQLVIFFEGIRSERQLIATASLHLAHRWYLGYALDEELPDHSSLTASGNDWGSTSSSASSRRSLICARRQAWFGAKSCTSTPPRWRPMPASRHLCRASPSKRRPTWPISSQRNVTRTAIRPRHP
jgi:hypothetical protein